MGVIYSKLQGKPALKAAPKPAPATGEDKPTPARRKKAKK